MTAPPGGTKGRRRLSWSWLLDLAIVVLGMTGTALLGIAIELGSQRISGLFQWSPLRGSLALSIPVVAALAVLLWVRTRRWRARGTLYYVSLLDEAHTDNIVGLKDEWEKRHKDGRVIVRHVDASDARVLDVRSHVADLRAELERLFNHDDHSTGYTIAPNLLAPAALGLGYDLALPTNTMFLELNQRAETVFEFTPRLDAPAPRPAGLGHVDLPRTDQRNKIWLTVSLTDSTFRLPLGENFDLYRVAGMHPEVAGQDGLLVDRLLVTTASDNPAGEHTIPNQVRSWSIGRREQRAIISPDAAAVFVAKEIHQALTDFEDAECLAVTIYAPKTVALVAGWRLRHLNRTGGLGSHPWRRMIPIRTDETGAWMPVWVRINQPDPSLFL